MIHKTEPLLLNGHSLAKELREELSQKVQSLPGRVPGLRVLLVGDDPASHVYVKNKAKACEEVGMRGQVDILPTSISQEQLLSRIHSLNGDPTCDGILVQLPLPSHIDAQMIMQSIDPQKDVDGFHPMNFGKLLAGDPSAFVPCTALGVQVMLQRYGLPIEGRHVVILGRSNIVGKPLAALLVQKAPGGNATVTLAHSRTKNLEAVCRSADILVAAIGQAQLVGPQHIRPGAVVVDVGMNRIPDASKKKGSRLVGDVDFDAVQSLCSAITPVPKGVGPMTIAMLLENTHKSFLMRER